MRKNKAFTIVEVIVIVVVIGILAGMVTLGWTNWNQKAEASKAKSDLNMAIATLGSEKNFKNGYPTLMPSTIKPSDGVDLKYYSDGSTYCIEARSTKVSGVLYSVRSSDPSAMSTTACGAAPAAPSPSVAGTSSSSITVSWSAVSGATSYTVRYGTSSPTATSSCSGSPCVISGLNASTTYRVNVTASNVYGSTTSATVTGSTPAALSCPSGGTLSGSTCTHTYPASYQNGSSGYYYCSSGHSLSGTTCTYTATTNYTCPSGGYEQAGYCYTNRYGGAPPQGCGIDYTVNGDCYGDRYTATSTKSCPSGGTVSGNNCTYNAYYQNGSSGYYYCPSGGSLSGTTCTRTYAAS
jgi:Tfp pilus assembly protein PilE